jgi:hypothetical protein
VGGGTRLLLHYLLEFFTVLVTFECTKRDKETVTVVLFYRSIHTCVNGCDTVSIRKYKDIRQRVHSRNRAIVKRSPMKFTTCYCTDKIR